MNWEPIDKAPMFVNGRDALVGQYVPGWGWKKVTIWEREWTRKDCISRGATHWWPHLRNLPEPQAVVGIPTNGDYGQTGSGSARSDQPDAYLVVKRDTLSAQRTTFATLPGYSLAPGETLISETPLYAAPQMLIDQSRSTRGCQSAAGEIQMTPTERRVYRANVVVQTLKPLDDTCMKCDYDEAEGYLINHCNDCCRRIVTKLWRLRERVMRRRCGEERDRK